MDAIQAQKEIPIPTQSWLQTTLGSYRVLSAHRVTSNRTAVWQLACIDQRYFFKLHYDRLVWHSEVYAYRQWATAYEPYTPQLIDVLDNEGLQGLLITAIAGIPLKESGADERAAIEVYRQAGRLCKHLHDLPAGCHFGRTDEQGVPVGYQGNPLGATATDPIAFIRDNFIELLTIVTELGALESDELMQAEWALERMDVFHQEVPTVVNSDNTPGNWLVDQEGKFVGVIDLEHIFRNVMIDAFTRLIVSNYPCGMYAFFEGFGRNPLLTPQVQARIVCLRHALFYVGYGVKLNNKSWIKRGREIFRQLENWLAPHV